MKLFVKQFAFLITGSMLFSTFIIKGDRVNFSGEWKLNEQKSELGTFDRRMIASTLKIEQKEDLIIITKPAPSLDGTGDGTTTETLSFDGKVSETPGFGNSKKKSTAKWSDDGQAFIINYTIVIDRNGQTLEIKGAVTWTLKNGSLHVVTVSSSPRGEMTTKAVYDK